MFQFESQAESNFTKVPTYHQWLKGASAAEIRPKYPIVTIWLPNKYPSASLETEKFRVRISEDNPLWLSLVEALDQITRTCTVLYIETTDTDAKMFKVGVLDGELAEWEPIGEYGWRCTIEDKPKASKRKR